MKFYDLNLRGQNYDDDLALVKEANKFGWDYLNLNYSHDNFEKAIEYKDDLIEELSSLDFNQTYRNKKTNFEHAKLSMGINILNANSNEIRKIINKYRNKSNYISCLGGDLKVNRSVCENHRIDVLSRPYYKRRDSGMNHVLAKEAQRNNVAIELCFRDILNNHRRYRANVISSFKEILMFHRKFKFPLILTTDSKSIYHVRSTRDIVAFFRSIGFSDEEIYNGFYYYPKKIVDFNKERQDMIIKGVKVVDSDDFTDTYDNLDSDLEKFDELEDFKEDLIDDLDFELIEDIDVKGMKMKLKVLPPTLRKNHHYLILDVKSEVEISIEEMLSYSWDACIRYWGENHSSNFDLWVMKHYLIGESTQNNEPIFNYKAVLRCGRSYEDDVRVALSTLTRQNKKRIAINTIGISGTIKSGVSKYIED